MVIEAHEKSLRALGRPEGAGRCGEVGVGGDPQKAAAGRAIPKAEPRRKEARGVPVWASPFPLRLLLPPAYNRLPQQPSGCTICEERYVNSFMQIQPLSPLAGLLNPN